VTLVSHGPIYFISDFNVEILARQVSNSVLPGTETRSAPFGQVIEALAAGPPGPEWSAVVWSQPASIIAAFNRALIYDAPATESAIEEARAYGTAIARFARGARATFVPTFVLPPWHRGYGPLDFRPGLGIAELVARLNLALSESLRDEPNVFVLDAARWIAAVGPRAWSDKLWYATKSPFTAVAFEQAALDIGAALAGLNGQARRLVVLDLDNILWGGSVGEVGWQGVALGGHDHAGEAFADFQRALKGLTRRGIQLAIVSKNDEATALEAIDRHPEMQMRRADFVGWKINWTDKGQNLSDLLTEIGLGAESAVFIDDLAAERARVSAAVPGVLVPDWPADPAMYREALASLRCFDAPFITAEDRGRSAMYAAERSRKSSLSGAGSLQAWLESLDINVSVEPLTAANLDRAAQLFNKTNQMNLATRRLSKTELMEWASAREHALLTFRVADRFGDSGLTGLVGLAYDGTRARLTDFLISCRVMGRNVEETLLHVAANHARERGAVELFAEFVPTPRNAPCLEFFRRSHFRAASDSMFTWNTSEPYPRPPYVTLRDNAAVVRAGNR
jgi:FkbH-like protein